MRVLHVTPYFAPAFGFGGPPQSILTLCQALVGAGLDVEVFTTTANHGDALPANVSGTRFEGVDVRYFPVDAPRLLLGSMAMRAALARDGRHADIIHVHGLFNASGWAAAAAARRYRRPLVVSVRGMLEPAARRHHRWRKHAAWALFDRRTVEQAALLHCTSREEQRTVQRAGLAPTVQIANPVAVSTDNLPDAERRALRQRLGLPDGARIVLFLGRRHPIKRLDLLSAAFSRVAGEFEDLHLVMAGQDDGVRGEDLLQAIGAARHRVRCCGPVYGREKNVLLAEASVAVLCSDSENFGMSIAEALCAGVPVVVTETCPWSDVARVGAGRWVPQSVEGIAGGLREVLADADEASGMGARGREFASRQFSPAHVAAEWRAAYEQVLAS